MKGFFAVVGGLVLLTTIFVGVAFAAWGWRWIAAPFEGKVGVREEIQSASFRISAYNHFFDLCASVQANEGRIDELEAVLGEQLTAFERERLVFSLVGVKSFRHEAIRDYNADARKNYTEGQFRDSDLPYQLADTDYKKGERKTSCGVD